MAAAVLALPALEVSARPKVRAEIVVIHAKKGPPYLHPRLRHMWKVLKKTFGARFVFYDLVSSQTKVLGKGDSMRVDLPEKRSATLTYKGVSTKDEMIRVSLSTGELKTNVRVADGGTFFQAGQEYKGGVLVISVKLELVK